MSTRGVKIRPLQLHFFIDFNENSTVDRLEKYIALKVIDS